LVELKDSLMETWKVVTLVTRKVGPLVGMMALTAVVDWEQHWADLKVPMKGEHLADLMVKRLEKKKVADLAAELVGYSELM
jgi:hypothetical protein